MQKNFAVRTIFLIALAATAFASGTFFYQQATQPKSLAASDPAQQEGCASLEKTFVQNQITQIPKGYAMTASATEHFDTAQNSCMVEMDFRTSFASGTWADNYVLFDATHNQMLADCFIEGGANPAKPFCNDDGHPVRGMIPQLSQQSFATLIASHMTE